MFKRIMLIFAFAITVLACGDATVESDDSGPWTYVAVTDGTTCGVAGEDVTCWGLYEGAEVKRFSGRGRVAIHRDQAYTFGEVGDQIASGYRGLCFVNDEHCGCSYTADAYCGRRGNTKLQAAAGSGGCALDADGNATCWGEESDEWGHGLLEHKEGQFKSIAMGAGYFCGVDLESTIRCTGDAPEPPEGAFRSIASSSDHLCAIRGDGTVVCWGSDEHGKATPPAGRFKMLAAGETHTCGLTTGGAIRCWGSDEHGESSGR